MKFLVLAAFITLFAVSASARYQPYSGNDWAATHEPWDFSGVLGLYNPGFGFQALAAYRVADGLIQNVDNSLSIESGLGWMTVSDTLVGQSVTYSEIEIPIMARWDFHLTDTKFIVGPRAGFNILSAGTAQVNGFTVTGRGGALYFQMGGFGMYQVNEKWAVRAQLMFINYTALTAGVTYFL